MTERTNPVYKPSPPSQDGHYKERVWSRLDNLLMALWGERTLVIVLLLMTLVAHAFNMFHFPSLNRFDDEGIYVSQAWSVLREGRLTPYTYWYDHAPAGWILVAGWMGLTGGPHAFGTAIDSARVFMLVLHLAMVPLLYHLARKLGASVPFAGLGTFMFSFSPLAITFLRPLLLDNIMLFWLLVSLNLLLDGWGRLSRIILSGITFGVALLTKETALFLLPAVLYIVWQQRWRHHGRFAYIAWLLPMFIVFSWYPLYALIKGELLPVGASITTLLLPDAIAGSMFSEGSQVSLTEALRWQGTRSGGGLFSPEGMFWNLVRRDWLPGDPIFMIGGVIAIFANLLYGLRHRRVMAAGLLGLMPLVYLARGGIVFDFYILFALPFMALNLAIMLTWVTRALSEYELGPTIAGFGAIGLAAILLGFYFFSGRASTLYQYKPDEPVREALAWIKQNVSPKSRMVITNDLWTDLREPGLGGPSFRNAHSHWKVASDPEVYSGIFYDNWKNIDYLVLSPTLTRQDLESTGNELAVAALDDATLVRRWGDDLSYVELWKVNAPSPGDIDVLQDSHLFIKRHFSQNGAYYDRTGVVTSENQAYAMLRAVWLDDQRGFYDTWRWTEANLMKDNGLLAWLWKDGEILDEHAASDADTDAALALLFAGKRWNDPQLIEAGTRLVRAIWDYEVVVIEGIPFMTAGEWAVAEPVIVLNPSYFSPYAYRVFNEVDPNRGWWELIDSSYAVIFEAGEDPLGKGESAGLPPDWVGIDPATGQLMPVQLETIPGDTTRYGYEAARTYWRLALDLRYVDDGRAESFLELAGFLADEYQRKNYISAVYTKDGQVLEDDPSMVGLAGAMAALLTREPQMGHEIYIHQINLGIHRQPGGVYWGDPNDLYTQEWGWFATALYADALPNLWWYNPASQ